jgi:hypothetical protein
LSVKNSSIARNAKPTSINIRETAEPAAAFQANKALAANPTRAISSGTELGGAFTLK